MRIQGIDRDKHLIEMIINSPELFEVITERLERWWYLGERC